MICPKCGSENKDEFNFCAKCASPLKPADTTVQITETQTNSNSGMKCRRCGSANIQAVSITKGKIKKRGCLATIFWIPFIIFTGLFGLVLALLTGGSHGKIKTKIQFVCLNCGNKWR